MHKTYMQVVIRVLLVMVRLMKSQVST